MAGSLANRSGYLDLPEWIPTAYHRIGIECLNLRAHDILLHDTDTSYTNYSPHLRRYGHSNGDPHTYFLPNTRHGQTNIIVAMAPTRVEVHVTDFPSLKRCVE